jgi:hypothetical protein
VVDGVGNRRRHADPTQTTLDAEWHATIGDFDEFDFDTADISVDRHALARHHRHRKTAPGPLAVRLCAERALLGHGKSARPEQLGESVA